jgi:hypothetical protein
VAQKVDQWGYRIFKRTGTGKAWKWKGMITASTHQMAEVLAQPYKTVLIVCQGCGNELLREYPETKKTK